STGIQGNLPLEYALTLIQKVNQLWQPVGIQFFLYGAIDYSIQNDDLYNSTTKEKMYALMKVNSVPGTINVYFANLGDYTGVSTLTDQSPQGVALNYSFPYPLSSVITMPELMAHELGHYFDLYHTHETKFGVECPNKSNCKTAGDLLCDTTADPKLTIFNTVNCIYDNSAPLPTASCGDTPYDPPITNLMSYARSECTKQFTGDQINKVLNTLLNNDKRKNLMNTKARYVDLLASGSNTNCTYTAPCRTVEKAVQAASNGDFIFIKAGAYWTPSFGGKRLALGRWGVEPGSGALLVP
ncbi:MAG: M43 family zinc metalloprotease, partial [Blastocatellia bacterium]